MLRISQVIGARRSAGDTNTGIVECGETVEESSSGVKARLLRKCIEKWIADIVQRNTVAMDQSVKASLGIGPCQQAFRADLARRQKGAACLIRKTQRSGRLYHRVLAEIHEASASPIEIQEPKVCNRVKSVVSIWRRLLPFCTVVSTGRRNTLS
jgi:hypothetical protein